MQDTGLFENKTFSILALVGAITCFLSFFSNLFTEFYFLVNLVLGLLGVTFSVFFYLSSIRGIFKPLILPFRILVIFVITLNWIYYQGIEGSTPFYFVLTMVGLIFSVSGKKHWNILISYGFLAVILIGLDYLYPEWVVQYPTENQRILDLSMGFTMSLFLVGLLSIALKRNFDLERSKTEEKKRELELSEARFRDIASSSGDWIWEVDANAIYTFCSEKVEEILGFSPDEIIGKTPFDFMPEEEAQKIGEEFAQIFRERRPFRQLENKNITKSGHLIVVVTSGIPVFGTSGELVGYRGTDTDITRHKLNESELKAAKEKAEESEQLKTAFLANMSHEIRTPMNGILGFTELLKEPMLTGEEQQKYIGIIEKSGARLLNIINDIISLSKVESGQKEISVSDTNINEQIEYIYTFFKPEVEKKGIQLSFKTTLPATESIIKTDREKIYAILTNLVKNAIKFTHEGSIEFGYEKVGQFLEFYVKDSGLGIPREQTETIFERFRQADVSLTRNYEGAGLGLTISKAYVEILGGRIWVESEAGKGSTFYFTIPYHAGSVSKRV